MGSRYRGGVGGWGLESFLVVQLKFVRLAAGSVASPFLKTSSQAPSRPIRAEFMIEQTPKQRRNALRPPLHTLQELVMMK